VQLRPDRASVEIDLDARFGSYENALKSKSLILRNSIWLPPALRQVSVADWKCRPVAHATRHRHDPTRGNGRDPASRNSWSYASHPLRRDRQRLGESVHGHDRRQCHQPSLVAFVDVPLARSDRASQPYPDHGRRRRPCGNPRVGHDETDPHPPVNTSSQADALRSGGPRRPTCRRGRPVLGANRRPSRRPDRRRRRRQGREA
jgi:hypothetical protein